MTALEGKFLRMLVTLVGANNILELGTGLGYSSYWMANAPGATAIKTIEYNPEYAAKAKGYFAKARLTGIELLEGNTQDILPQINEQFDLIFMDHFKDYYVPDLATSLKLLKKGGLFLAHNALEGGWASGSAEEDLRSDKLRNFHDVFLAHPELDSVILPIGEGFAFGIKR